MSAAQSSTDKPYRINTSSLNDSDFATSVHNIDVSSIRQVVKLGDACGLTKVGVNLVRLPPHTNSSEIHWHSTDEEWIYILEAGKDGGKLLTLPEGESEVKEEIIRDGDFLAFPAGTRLAHVLRGGEQELVYLCSGTREPLDVCVYPKAGKRLTIDRSKDGDTLLADESNLLVRRGAYAV